jgi:cysteine desulfurase / selenocysteine lyase
MDFDQAATSFPKPPGVVEGVAAYLQDVGAPAGRGGYRAAVEVARVVNRCRSRLATLFAAPSPNHVVFTQNGTDSLNLAILGLCRPGMHVISTTWEHNSVLRPLRFLMDQQGVEVTWIEPGSAGLVDPAAIEQALRPETQLVVLQHANNVVGVIQPLAAVAEIVRRHGAYLLVDAAQTAGHLPLSMSETPIDLLATSGHKGLLGPLGMGILALSARVVADLNPVRFGGTGSHSEDDRHPETLPDKYEAGNLNVPGIIGLDAALQWGEQHSKAERRAQEEACTQALWQGLASLSGVTLYGADPRLVDRVGVISLNIAGYAPHEAAAILDEHFGIATRAGLHCAPGVHRSLGTLSNGGTLRLSLGPMTTLHEIDQLLLAIRTLCGSCTR